MKSRPKVNKATKQRLINEARGKCANPGCSNILIEIHHIKRWHVVRTHNPDDMIAICPACHDAVDRGSLKIDDETAYSWKKIENPWGPMRHGHLYIEPGRREPGVSLGSIEFRSRSNLFIFNDNREANFSFRVQLWGIMDLNVTMVNTRGETLFKMVNGHFIAEPGPELEIHQRAGRIRVLHPNNDDLWPEWLASQTTHHDPSFVRDSLIPALDMEVIAPNHVRLQGVFNEGGSSFAITRNRIVLPNGVALAGEDGVSVINWMGPSGTPVFNTLRERAG